MNKSVEEIIEGIRKDLASLTANPDVHLTIQDAEALVKYFDDLDNAKNYFKEN